MNPERRDFLKTGAALTAAAMSPLLGGGAEAAQRPLNAEDAGTLERIWRQNTSPNQSILLRGGTVVSMDPKVGDFVRGDVLIQGKKIAAIARAEGAAASPGDRRQKHDRHSGIRGRASALLGRPTAAHHS